MNWWTVIATFIAAVGGPAVVLKILGDRLLERQKAHYSKEMAEIAHERSVLLAERQNAFSMGANSHMAVVVFDKHIAFCEEYVGAASSALYPLIQEGKRDQPLDARDFFKIRQKWALWLNHEIEVKLERFERGIPRIGAEAWGMDENGDPESDERSFRRVIADLREILGTEELTILRKTVLATAAANTGDAGPIAP
jgi:hypothetical protein